MKYKFIRKGFKSENGNTKWKIGKWQKPIKDLVICERGYHCSKTIYQAFSYVQGEILCQVECKGKKLKGTDKEVWENQRVVRAWKWTKKDSVALAIYAAELCIENFEKAYFENKRPREAIEAAKKFLKYPTKANKKAARSAAWSARSAAKSAAWSAWSARSAAWSARSAAESAARSAVWSERSAAWSARSAAESAARSAARSAVWSAAESAARSAARSAVINKISKWMNERLKVLKEIK
jgi:hypothetical protein